MPKMVQFTLASADRPSVFVNPDLVRSATSSGASGGSIIHFDGQDKIGVHEPLDEVVRRLAGPR